MEDNNNYSTYYEAADYTFGSPDSVSDGEKEAEVVLASTRPKKRAGRKVIKETRHPVYRGVRERNNGKWVCEVREPNTKTKVCLGTYATAEMAARAHDVAAIAFRGKSACLNFADSEWRIPMIQDSTDHVEIRRVVAAVVAEEFGGKVDLGDYPSYEMEEPGSGSGLYNVAGSSREEGINTGAVDTGTDYDMGKWADWPLMSPTSCPDGVHGDWDSTECSEGDFGFNDVSLWNF